MIEGVEDLLMRLQARGAINNAGLVTNRLTNPDGPEAAALIRQLKADNERLEAVRDAILSAGNSRNDGGMITFGVWSLRKLDTAFNLAAQSLNQTERGEA